MADVFGSMFDELINILGNYEEESNRIKSTTPQYQATVVPIKDNIKKRLKELAIAPSSATEQSVTASYKNLNISKAREFKLNLVQQNRLKELQSVVSTYRGQQSYMTAVQRASLSIQNSDANFGIQSEMYLTQQEGVEAGYQAFRTELTGGEAAVAELVSGW